VIGGTDHHIQNVSSLTTKPFRYVYDSEIKTFGSVAARQQALSKTGWLGRAWAQNYTTTTRLPLHPSLGPPNTDHIPDSSIMSNESLSHAALSFVHGGLAPNFPYLTPYPSRINDIASSLLYKLQARPQVALLLIFLRNSILLVSSLHLIRRILTLDYHPVQTERP
jgi:hypothetical protein